jgi:serine/threonine protein kinase
MASSSDLDLIDHFKLDAVVTATYTTHFEYEIDQFRRVADQKVEKRWDREQNIGRGAFGEVWLEVKREHGDVQKRAVKVINKSLMRGLKLDYKKELHALAKFSKARYLQEKVLVQFFGWYEDVSDLFISMEYFSLGDLQSHITDSITIDDVKDMTLNLLNGLRIMHSEGFAHRDLKPSNIFVLEKPPASRWWVKIGDFGISKRVRSDETALRTSLGTSVYQAPEVRGLFETNGPTSMYDNVVDIWSLGCVIYKIATQTELFPKSLDVIKFCENKQSFSEQPLLARLDMEGVQFVKSLVVPNPRERLSAERALEASWLSQRSRHATSKAEESFESFISSMAQSAIANEMTPEVSNTDGKIGESIFSSEIIRMMNRLGLMRHTLDNQAVVCSLDGKTMTSAADDSTIRLWESARALRQPLKTQLDDVLKLAFFSNDKNLTFLSKEKKIAFAHRSEKILLWNTERHNTVFMLKEPNYPVTVMAFSSNDEMTTSAYVAKIRLWCTKSGTTRRMLEDHTRWVLMITFSPNSKMVTSSGYKTIKFWKSATESMRQTSENQTGWASIIAFSSDDKTMAFASNDQTIKLWDCETEVTRQTLKVYTGKVIAIKFLSRDKTVAAAFHDKTIKLWDSATGMLQISISDNNVDWSNVNAFSPSGSTVAFGLSQEETIEFWNLIFDF